LSVGKAREGEWRNGMDQDTSQRLDGLEQRMARVERQLKRTWIPTAGPNQHDDTVAQMLERIEIELKALRAEVRGTV
jgi:archaellum component FlaC